MVLQKQILQKMILFGNFSIALWKNSQIDMFIVDKELKDMKNRLKREIVYKNGLIKNL